jgi:hypothetical protein
LTVALIAAFAGCGGEENPEQQGIGSSESIGVGIEQVDCTDWNDASPEERFGTVDELENFLGGPVSGNPGATGKVLDDQEAYDLFEEYCGNEYARAFKLYKLYSRAAAFQDYQPPE